MKEEDQEEDILFVMLAKAEGCCFPPDDEHPDWWCADGGPGPGCFPTGSPQDDGCMCDEPCYTTCFDCCDINAEDCCTYKTPLESLFEPPSQELEKITIENLEKSFAEFPNVSKEDAWEAANQCGAVIRDGLFHFGPVARIPLVICLDKLDAGSSVKKTITDHRADIVSFVTQTRIIANNFRLRKEAN
jgi:hypothetical protein